jgi:2-polyprenyl-6-methoxyphenol hydroxylase-like FAD-dependent oxidoreductase
MPQWDLLNFLAGEVRKFPSGKILMEHQVTGLLSDPANRDRIVGARAEAPPGTVEVRATLTVGCDGRHAVTTEAAHLEHEELGAPIDVLWLRLSRRADDPENALGNLNYGRMIVLINRGDYFQCGYIIKKGTLETEIKPAGLAAFRESIARLVPFLGVADSSGKSRVDEITSWEQVPLLSVQVNRLTRWHREGLLCIGDAAHAMSPVGGIGINLAIEDAVAAARILRERLCAAGKSGQIAESALAEVQKRRDFPTRVTQSFQVKAHGFLKKYLGNPAPARAPGILRFLSRSKLFRRLTARFIGLGVRPENVDWS